MEAESELKENLEDFVDEEEEDVLPVPTKHTSKDRFQRYLDKSGVSATILRGLVSLFEEQNKPNDPIRYLCEQWGFGIPEIDEVDDFQSEVEQLRKRYDFLFKENERLNLLMQPEPTAAEVLGLDEETEELLRKQEAELAQIQHREACILKAFAEGKVNAAKQLKIPICKPVGTTTAEEEGTAVVTPPPVPLGVVELKEDEGEGEADAPTIEVLGSEKCSLEWLRDPQKSQPSTVFSIISYQGDTTVTIPLEELKNPPRFFCGLSTHTQMPNY